MGPERSIIPFEMERAEPLRGSRLGELYVRHAPDGIRLAFLLTGDRALAEDLVQEAFARFVGRLLHLRNPEAFEPYLRRTIVNLSRSYFRHRKVERVAEAAVWVSADGRNWARVSSDPVFRVGRTGPILMRAVVAWGSRFVAAGEYWAYEGEPPEELRDAD